MAVVLAGGRSRRMGRDKAFLEVGGRELLERALATGLEAAGEALLVVGNPAPYRAAVERYRGSSWARADRPRDVRIVRDRRPGAGPMAGLEAALAAAPGRPVWLLACDMPFVTPEVGRHLLAELAALRRAATRTGAADGDGADRDEAAAVVPFVGGRAQPLCAAYAPAVGPVARSLLDRGEREMAALLRQLRVLRIAEDHWRRFGRPERLLRNLNSPSDLRRARGRAGRGLRE